MNSNKITKLLGTIIGIVLFIALIAGVTYAWVTWYSSNINLSGTAECFDINYNIQTLSDENVLLFDESAIIANNKLIVRNGMALLDLTAGTDSSCNIKGNLTLSLNSINLNDAFISGDSVGAFKYALVSYDPSTYTNLTVAALNGKSFDIIKNDSITSTEEITLITEDLTTATKGYLIIFYIDGDLAFNDAQNSTFSVTLKGVANQYE